MESTESLKTKVNWKFQCFDKNGNLKWDDIGDNLVVTEGFNSLFDVMFNSDTQIDTWYIGLKGAGTPAAADTLTSHPTWTEDTNYDGDRKQFVTASASAAAITNSASKATFVFNGTTTIAGGFICSAATGTTGTLFSVKDFTLGSKSPDSGDTLIVEVNISGTSS